MKPVFFLFLLATLVALLLPAAATPAQPPGPTDWKQVPYFDVSTSELRLSTEAGGYAPCNWTGGTPVTNVNSPDWKGWGCYPSFIWAKTCKGAPQSVEITKKVYLPGRPR